MRRTSRSWSSAFGGSLDTLSAFSSIQFRLLLRRHADAGIRNGKFDPMGFRPDQNRTTIFVSSGFIRGIPD
jgi:hypothetical protein